MRARSRRGSGLVLNLMVVTVVSAVAAGLVVSLRSLKRESLYQKALLEAQALAEAGAEDALRSLALDPAWRAGFAQKALAGGDYTVRLTTAARPTVTATGRAKPLSLLGRPFRTVRFKAEALPVPRLDYAVLAHRDATLSGLSSVDSYNSETDLDPLVFGAAAAVRANDELDFDDVGVAVFGDALYRAGSAPSSATVTGTITQVSVSTPVPHTDGSAYQVDNDNLSGISPSSVFDPGTKRLVVPLGSSATIKSGVYYLRRLVVNGELTARVTNGPVVIFLDGDGFVNGAFLNPTRIPANLLIYGDGVNQFDLASPQRFHAVLEHRWGNVSVASEMYGAVAARFVTLSGVGRLHYDQSLQRPPVAAVRVVPLSWETLALRP